MATELDLITVGNCCVDLFVPPHAAPVRGGITLIDSLDLVPGGNGLNTAVAAARLGARTAVAGVLGDDVLGRHLASVLGAEAVDTSLLTLSAGRASPATIVLNDASGERSFVHNPGTNADFTLPTAALESPTRVFHLAAPELLGTFWPGPCLEAARALRRAGRLVSLDVFASPDADAAALVSAHAPLLELCDIALPNEDEARLITGTRDIRDAARAMHDRGVRVAVIKRGPAGALVSTGGEMVDVPTETVEAVDTCGAGDNFAGGFLAAWLRGLDPVASARVGCALGTRCVQSRGSLEGTATAEFLARVKGMLDS